MNYKNKSLIKGTYGPDKSDESEPSDVPDSVI